MSRAKWTGNGLVLVGRLTVLPEDDAALVQVGGDFLDDALRERFGRGAVDGTGGHGDADDGAAAARTGPDEPVVVDRVRITVERLDS